MSDKLSLFSFKPHPVPLENGNTSYVRRVSANEKVEWVMHLRSLPDAEKDQEMSTARDINASLLVKTVCDEKGNRYFEDGETDLVKEIDDRTFDLLAKEASRINGLSEEGRTEFAKNS